MRLWIAGVVLAAAAPVAAQDFELEFSEQALNRLIASLGHPSSGGIHQPNILATLGYKDCGYLGLLDCPVASPGGGLVPSPVATPGPITAPGPVRGQPAAAKDAIGVAMLVQVPFLTCTGPDGRPATVPGLSPVSWQWWITQARFKIETSGVSFTAKVRYRVDQQWGQEEKTVPATFSFDAASQNLRMALSPFKVPIRYSAMGLTEPVTEVDVGRHLSFAVPVSTQTLKVRTLDGAIGRTLTGRAQSANVAYLAGRLRVSLNATFY